jgi:YD repeat-containing protein
MNGMRKITSYHILGILLLILLGIVAYRHTILRIAFSSTPIRLGFERKEVSVVHNSVHGAIVTTSFDALGRMELVQNQRGYVRSQSYDAADRLTADVSPQGYRTTYSYNVFDARNSVQNATAADFMDQMLTYISGRWGLDDFQI